MTKISLIFPGQGSQNIGMGQNMFNESTAAKLVFEEVNNALNENLSKLIFTGNPDELTLTTNAQPALMTVSIAVIKILEEKGFKINEQTTCVGGHSLGEYSALAATNAINIGDTAKLLRLRGTAMQSACPKDKGSMAAILGAELQQVQEFANSAAQQSNKICDIANDNAPGQIVISGHCEAVNIALQLATKAGIRKSVLLPVSAPFHCTLMEGAVEPMKDALENVTMNTPSVPIIANVTAEPVSSVADIKRLLLEQLTGRVRWRESMLRMRSLGCDLALECGHGKVLNGLLRRIDKDFACQSLQNGEDIDNFLTSLS